MAVVTARELNATDPANLVTLLVNNLNYAGWMSVRVETGVERAARSFELGVSWPRSLDVTLNITQGDSCQVFIGQDLVCTGWVDAIPINYDANQVTVMVKGRSRTADLVDCSAVNRAGQFSQMSPEAIIAAIAKAYGVDVVVQTATGAPLTQHQIQQGETAFESIDRIAKARQFLITDDALGNLVIAQAGSAGTANTGLALGVNILSGSAGFDYSEIYSSYQVKGQKSGTDDSSGVAASQLLGAAADSTLSRTRVLVVRQSGQADAGTCQQRADYEAQVRKAKANEIRYRVEGWRQGNGALWAPNLTTQVTDAIMGVNDSRLINECFYLLDDGGMVCEMAVIAPEAFLTDPEKAAKALKAGKKKKSASAGWPE